MEDPPLENILMNGSFSRDSWSRLNNPSRGVQCQVWRQTYAADRWKIRYASPQGAAVFQAWSPETPEDVPCGGSLEIRGCEGLTEDVLLGQRVEAAEAVRYRRKLCFSAWVFYSAPVVQECPVYLVTGSAQAPNVFGDPFNSNVRHETIDLLGNAAVNQWVRFEHEIDARAFGSDGLSVELQFCAPALSQTGARIRVAGAALSDACGMPPVPPACAGRDCAFTKRFFQRHDIGNLNSIGRALAVNAHELFFQLPFPEMRAAPECTLPRQDEGLNVFATAGFPVTGFTYDAVYRSRATVIIRATRKNHGLRDGYLSFTGPGAAILLDAEL